MKATERRLPRALPISDEERRMAVLSAREEDLPSPDDARNIRDQLANLLRDEVEADPERRGYTGKTPQEIADKLNLEHRVIRKVPGPLTALGAPEFASLAAALGDPEWSATVQGLLHSDHEVVGRWLGEPDRVLALLVRPREIVVKVLAPRWPRLIQGMSHVPSTIGAGDIADLLGVSDG